VLPERVRERERERKREREREGEGGREELTVLETLANGT
jgi:hypothetical protein